MWALLALSKTLQVKVVHLRCLNLAFGTAPLSAGQGCVCAAMASGVLWFIEGRKLLRRLFAYVDHRTDLRPRNP
jgi:Ca2+-transporting ATPase